MYPKLKFKVVDFTNVEKAITIQREIFPNEDGLLNLLASLDRELFIKISNLDYIDDHIKYYLAFDGDNIVGITGFYFYPDHPEEMWLAWFGVLPAYRNKGYATAILKWSIEKALTSGKKVLRLYADLLENAQAIQLYKKMGFIGEKYTIEKLTYNCYIFSKMLDTSEYLPWDNRNLGLAHQSSLEKIDTDMKKQIYDIYKSLYLK